MYSTIRKPGYPLYWEVGLALALDMPAVIKSTAAVNKCISQPMPGTQATTLVIIPRMDPDLGEYSRKQKNKVMACNTNMTPSAVHPVLRTKLPPINGMASNASARPVIHNNAIETFIFIGPSSFLGTVLALFYGLPLQWFHDSRKKRDRILQRQNLAIFRSGLIFHFSRPYAILNKDANSKEVVTMNLILILGITVAFLSAILTAGYDDKPGTYKQE